MRDAVAEGELAGGELPDMANRPDDRLVEIITQVQGIEITHHYPGQQPFANQYYIHMVVEDQTALHRLCQLAGRANAPLQVYEHSEMQFRYTLIVNDHSREILLSEALKNLKIEPQEGGKE
jgi:hypothetical protein